MNKKILLLSAAVFAFGTPKISFAQESKHMVVEPLPKEKPTALEERFTVKEKKVSKNRIITFSLENDLFGGGTDENYTSGVRLTYMDIDATVPNIVEKIVDFIPTININETTSIYYSAGHNIYTPEDISKSILSSTDRPYAAWLYASTGLTTVSNNHLDELEISLGTVGDVALGEDIQRFFHKQISVDEPQGWDTQIKNEPGLILSWQRSWPAYKKIKTLNYDIYLSPHIGFSLGNIYTYGSIGGSIRLTSDDQNLQLNPIRVRPAIPGSGYYDIPADDWGWYLFSGFDVRAIARNIFLDGNTFRDSPSIDKKTIVADLNTGVALTYKDLRISYSVNYRTKEYKTQSNDQIFGSISISKRF